jgi:hypothetical protein
MLQTFYSGVILTSYMVNKDFIAKNLCENRDKPMMHCNGKCHLRKQLAEQQKKEDAPVQSLKEKLELQFFSKTTPLIFTEATPEIIPFNSSYLFFIPKTALASVFHPPRTSVYIS